MSLRFGSHFRFFKPWLVFIPVLAIVFSCATIVAPSGGLKDEIAPTLVRSNPQNQSTGFADNRIILEFSEFVEIRDLEKNLLISPPLSKDPDFRIKGKSIIVRLHDSLRSNSTYSFYFGDAIVDITERNPLKNFSFALSTGDVIDSLSISGTVTDAFTREPVKDVLVMLYSSIADSAPMTERPVYVSRTLEGGRFVLNSLAAGKYRVVALKDGNSDYLYNLPNELVAFADSLVEPFYIGNTGVDSAGIAVAGGFPNLSLDLFPEPDSTQRLLKGLMTAPNILTLYFRYPVNDPVYTPLNTDTTLSWSIREYSNKRDTLTCWLTGILPDSLKLKVEDPEHLIDTLLVSTQYKPRSQDKGRTAARADTSLTFSYPGSRTRQLGWGTPFQLTFTNPVSYFDSTGAFLVREVAGDTLRPMLSIADQINRRFVVDHDWRTGEKYELVFPQGIFRDIYGKVNDTVRARFSVKSKEEYGQFSLLTELVNINYPLILQLLDEKGNVIKQRRVFSSGKVDFGYLEPGKFRMKAIHDANRNGKWDTGNFLGRQQPEKVSIHPKVFEIRQNWELEEEWKI